MNAKEVFERVKKHLLKQNARAVSGTNKCRYRTDSGMRCAVGCLIPSGKYTSEIEDTSLEELNRDVWVYGYVDSDRRAALAQTLVECDCPPETWRALELLQDVHDAYEPHEWERRLDEIYSAFPEVFR